MVVDRQSFPFKIRPTFDGSEIRRSPVDVGNVSHYLQGSKNIPKWFLDFLHQQHFQWVPAVRFMMFYEDFFHASNNFSFSPQNSSTHPPADNRGKYKISKALIWNPSTSTPELSNPTL